MSYRDELEAATLRAAQTAKELEDERAKLLVKEQEIGLLQSALKQANSQLVVAHLDPVAVGAPPRVLSVSARALLICFGALSVMAITATAFSAMVSETLGMRVAQIALIVPASWLGIWLSRHRSVGAMLGYALLFAVVAEVMLQLFFLSIWPSL